jgi:hypothetical protein
MSVTMMSSVKISVVKEMALMWMNSSSKARSEPNMMTLPEKGVRNQLEKITQIEVNNYREQGSTTFSIMTLSI